MKALMFFFLLAHALAAHAARNPEVDALFADYARPDVPGASVTVIRNGEVVYAQAYGAADLAEGTAATTATNYRLASLTKQFTAMAILQLAAAGKLSLDDSLTTLFPDFPEYGSRITVSHLLHHTGGLRDYEDLIPSSQTEQVSDRDVLALLMRQKSGMFAPGSQYHYSNGGYVLLGLIVEAASGETFPDYLKRHVFEPIGMTHSVMHVEGVTTVENRAFGYTRSGGEWKKTDQSVTSATLGDGGVYTSVDELFLWDQALYGETLLPAAWRDLLFTPGELNGGGKTKYGMGWMLDTYRGLRRVHHTGSTIGFRTAIARFPEKGFSVAVLVNRANSEPWRIAEKVTDLYLFGR